MADQIVKLVDDTANAGQKVDCATLTVGGNTVLRQKVCFADPTTAAAVAAVKAASTVPAATDPALVVALSPGSPLTKYKKRDLINTVVALKASPGVLFGVQIVNNTAATVFVQVFDLATGSVTLGTTTPDLEFQVDANKSLPVPFPARGVNFATAISIAATTLEGGSISPGTGVQLFGQYV